MKKKEPTIDISLGNFFGVTSILIGFVCFLLAVFLSTVPSTRKLPNRLLAAFLMLTAIELSAWLWSGPGASGSWQNGLRLALGTLQMPLFLGFFVSTCYSDFKLKTRDAFHLLPFVAALVLILPGNQIPYWADSGTGIHVTGREQNIFQIGAHIQYYAYMIAVVAVLWQFRRLFREYHSGARSEVLTWLTQFAAVSLFAHTLIVIRNLLTFSSANSLVLALQIFGILLALAITTWLALTSLFQPHLFRDVDRALVEVSKATSNRHDNGETASLQLNQLQAFMEANEPYLDPKLSLSSLSDQMAMIPREVSELLNQSLGVHFFDFVNGYRIKKAQHLLLAQPRQSIIEILYDVGFNSKSSFNAAFKKHTGLTPSAYRALDASVSNPHSITA